MNNVIFNTHTTLTENHADLSLWSLSQQPINWDNFILYNSHETEISSSIIEKLIHKHDLSAKIKNIHKIEYDENSPKSLGFDLMEQFKYCLNTFDINDHYLLLKSDYSLSKNFYKSFNSVTQHVKYFYTLPTVNAKEFVSVDEIKVYLNREKFIPYDDVTYSHGSDMCSTPPHKTLNNFTDLDIECRFVSCHILKDYNCHVLDGNTMKYYNFAKWELNSTWGGFNGCIDNFLKNNCEFICNDDCFSVHMYHDIVSKNRQTPREDHRKNIPGNRY